MFVGTKKILFNVKNVEVVRQEEDGHVEVVGVSGRTYQHVDPKLIGKLMRPRRSRLVRLICWILGV